MSQFLNKIKLIRMKGTSNAVKLAVFQPSLIRQLLLLKTE